MPGSGYELTCPGCRRRHELTTGAGFDGDRHWNYRHYVCPSCRALHSLAIAACEPEAKQQCPGCRTGLAPWKGRTWHEVRDDGMTGPEQIEGPCPACGERLTSRDSFEFLLWD